MEEEKQLNLEQADKRKNQYYLQLKERPHPKDQNDIAFCDEYYFSLGIEETYRIKRRSGNLYRYLLQNVYRKKGVTKKDKEKAREKKHLKLFNVFVVIGRTQKKFFLYKVDNQVGKISLKAYTEQVLLWLLLKFNIKGITLYQDADSAHKLRESLAQAKEWDLKLLILPGLLLDLLIIESLAYLIKKKFYLKRVEEKDIVLERFIDIWENQVDQEKILEMYSWYTKRLHECIRANGQITRY